MELIYKFRLPDDRCVEYKVELDDHGRYVLPAAAASPPEWTRLENCQCRTCPLAKEDHPFCPPARSMADMLEVFSDIVSFQPTALEIVTPNRVIKAEVDAQEGLRSLMGLLMATSGCPILDKLRPMGRFHLPFADEIETIYRSMSMFLIAQYFRREKGLEASFDFSGLAEIYQAIHAVNQDFIARVRGATEKESAANSLVVLDSLAQLGAAVGEDFGIAEVEPLFSAYFEPDDT